MQVHLREFRLPLKRTLRTAAGTIKLRNGWLIGIADDHGHVGWGEAAPLPSFGGEDPLACHEALTKAVTELPKLAESWLERQRIDAPLGRIERELAATPVARACIEGALIDLAAQRVERPIAALLAERVERTPLASLPVNALLGGDTPENLAEAASALVSHGWRTIKLKASGVIEDDIKLARLVRDWVGDRIKLRIDANGSWTRDTARQFLVATREVGLEYVEQPLPPEDLDGAANLRRLAGAPIAADEAIRRAADVGQVAAHQAADVVILKPAVLGGWRPTWKAIELARSLDLGVVLTSFIDGAVGRAHASHIAAAAGVEGHAHGLSTGSMLKADNAGAPLATKDGMIALNQAPGLGIGTITPGG